MCVSGCVCPYLWFDLPSSDSMPSPPARLSLGHWLPLHFRHIDVCFSSFRKHICKSLRFDFVEDIAQAVDCGLLTCGLSVSRSTQQIDYLRLENQVIFVARYTLIAIEHLNSFPLIPWESLSFTLTLHDCPTLETSETDHFIANLITVRNQHNQSQSSPSHTHPQLPILFPNATPPSSADIIIAVGRH